MKKINVEVNRGDVFDAVALSSGYRAIKRSFADGDGEKKAIGGGDKRMVGWYFDDCVAECITTLRPFVKDVVNSDEKFGVKLGVGDDWDETLLSALTRHLRMFMAAGILGRWLETIGDNDSIKALAEAKSELEEVQGLLYHRPAPTRLAGVIR